MRRLMTERGLPKADVSIKPRGSFPFGRLQWSGSTRFFNRFPFSICSQVATIIMQRVLVTGGAGFIGSTLVRRLLAIPSSASLSIEVLNYDALTYAGLKESLVGLESEARYRLVQANVNNAEKLFETIQQFQPDTVIHLAAESHVDRSIAKPDIFIETNIRGTATLLKAWLAYRDRLPSNQAEQLRFLHVSTDEVYGSIPQGKDSVEGDIYRPSSPYSASKAAADHLVDAYRRTYGLQSIICHSTNNYGPRQIPEKLIPLVIRCAVAKEPIPVYGDGQQERDWLHVNDHCDALIKIAKQGRQGESYHIGAAELRTNLEVIGLLCDLVDEQSGTESSHRLITHVEDRPGHDARYSLNANKLRSELDWKPLIDFETGLSETVAWYLENQAWVEVARAQE